MTSPRSIGPVRFGPGAEFDLIRRLINPDDLLPIGVDLGPGDDAAAVSYTHLTLPTILLV